MKKKKPIPSKSRFSGKKSKSRKKTSLGSASSRVPGFVKKTAQEQPRSQYDTNGKILVIIQLSGGNDGLNSIVPYTDDIYYRNRPKVSIPRKEVLPLNHELGLNPALAALRPLYDNGYVSILNSVGYPNPSRSHFRSMDIWQSGSDADTIWQTGWIGRYLDALCDDHHEAPPHLTVELNNMLSLALKGHKQSGVAFERPEKLYKNLNQSFFRNMVRRGRNYKELNNAPLSYLYKMAIDSSESAKYIYEKTAQYSNHHPYPKTALSYDLKTISNLIQTDSETTIYYASLGSFDTHIRQKGVHERLLKTYAEAVTAFVDDLKAKDRLKDVLIMTFSEFGRRVGENNSQGTDHGSGNNLLIMGENLAQPGFYNEAPDLKHLINGDVGLQIDFRQVYATVLDQWLGANSTDILGQSYEQLHFINNRIIV